MTCGSAHGASASAAALRRLRRGAHGQVARDAVVAVTQHSLQLHHRLLQGHIGGLSVLHCCVEVLGMGQNAKGSTRSVALRCSTQGNALVSHS